MKIYVVEVILGAHSTSKQSIIADKLLTSNGCHTFYVDNEISCIFPVDRTIITSITSSKS